MIYFTSVMSYAIVVTRNRDIYRHHDEYDVNMSDADLAAAFTIFTARVLRGLADENFETFVGFQTHL